LSTSSELVKDQFSGTLLPRATFWPASMVRLRNASLSAARQRRPPAALPMAGAPGEDGLPFWLSHKLYNFEHRLEYPIWQATVRSSRLLLKKGIGSGFTTNCPSDCERASELFRRPPCLIDARNAFARLARLCPAAPGLCCRFSCGSGELLPTQGCFF
jgi:hypothetical protein